MKMSLRPYIAYIQTRFRVLRRNNSEGQSVALLIGLIVGFTYVLVQPDGKGAYYYGRQFADGATVEELTTLTTQMTMVTTIIFSFLMYRNMVKATKFLDRRAFVATSVPRRTQITSLLLYQFLFFSLLLIVPVAIA